ncbi:Scr1 family TA system antitoxin-like transcriptional regulator [Actinomadura rupiterrae]|uniref:Scr1 family TA system antitoxin-like transcriptional regulator n=1 Tax=Actinomadura rupiterrae TaxID=559627 RepID=UPI0020A53CFB|nr:Scr1 family TA system antitoxin-like transcriptional regulator [Actinomadura rupiterrae]MCP2341226.1 transcriptional regulator with XRE-family HTH domain [Actinomadura rupiterrae]
MEEAPERYQRGVQELADALRELRVRSGLTGTQVAERTGASQPRISRIETGSTVPTVDMVETLCRVYSASSERTAQLVELATALHRRIESRKVLMRGGAWNRQQQIARAQREAKSLRIYQPVMVTGLLQAPDYARQIYGMSLEGEALAKSLRALHDRQKTVLSSRHLSITVVLSEAALRWRLADDQAMLDQLRHLRTLLRRPRLRLGIVPFATRVSEIPLHGFEIYDERLVTVGTETQVLTLTGSDVQHYEGLFAAMERAADFAGADTLIESIAAEFSSQPRDQ